MIGNAKCWSVGMLCGLIAIEFPIKKKFKIKKKKNYCKQTVFIGNKGFEPFILQRD